MNNKNDNRRGKAAKKAGFKAVANKTSKKAKTPAKTQHTDRKKAGRPLPASTDPKALLLDQLRQAMSQSLNVKQLLQDPDLKAALQDMSAMDLLAQLQAEGKVEDTGGHRFRADIKGEQHEGTLLVGKDGSYGVAIKAFAGEEIVLYAEGIQAFHGDTILVELMGRKKRHIEARLVQFIRHARETFVGTLDRQGSQVYVLPTDSRIRPDLLLRGELQGANPGDKVQVRLTGWRGQRPFCEIVQVLGRAGEHNTEIHAIVLEFGLDTKFPEAIEQAANAIPDTIAPDELARRRDFRDVLTFTIDPVDAKDFDDAISYKELGDGRYEIGVHIADVTHYLQPGTLLDQEAYDRATSVYLVDRTLPMLPERLSNHLCSLVPHQDRLTFSAVFVLDDQGHIHSEWFGRTVIHSARRFTYEEVQAILDSGSGEHAQVLTKLNAIAHALRKTRFAEGSISFEQDEVRFRLDENYKPIEVFKKLRVDSHKLVEDYMLLANRRVAHHVAHIKRAPHQVPFVYRIHDIPGGEKLANLRQFVASFGYRLDIDDPAKTARSLNKLVSDVVGKPEENLIQTVAIRSMPKAIYTTNNMGHYGLGFEFYTHFTSPIRRYPDVLVHRILQDVLDKKLDQDTETLELMCKHCSEREKRAADAERASIKYKQIEYLGGLVGQSADGTISGVTDWGIYVELDENKCEGMIPLRDLHDDHYELDEKTYTLKGKRSKQTFRLGDRLRVQVKKTNLVKRNADFKLVKKI